MATGKGSYFRLEDSAGVMTDWSPHVRAITAANEAEEVDGTVITSTKREFEPTFERDRMTVRLKWSAAAVDLSKDVKGLIDLGYEYGPNGSAIGAPAITGTVNVLRAQTIGGADPSALTELEVELNINSEEHGVFPIVPLAREGRGREREAREPARR
jgi:hypothetical protein